MIKKLSPNSFYLLCPLLLCLFGASAGMAQQTTAFSYQGRLSDGGTPANGNYDFEFRLFDMATGGAALATQQRLGVQVLTGVFTVQLDFGASVFNGSDRFLEIAVQLAGGSGFTTLSPRQKLASTPYAIRSLGAANADNAMQLGGIDSSGFIQNSTTQQTNTNFNISGSGTAAGSLSATSVNGGTVNAITQFNLNGSRILSASGTGNLSVGLNAGATSFTLIEKSSVLVGQFNTFVGDSTGLSNTNGNENTFIGSSAGASNTTGDKNTFVGRVAGFANQGGVNNSFFGFAAGFLTSGSQNSFFGAEAGKANTGGDSNSFFGVQAGKANTGGSLNSFFGAQAGLFNTSGSQNSFFGESTGQNNSTGIQNSYFGSQAGIAQSSGDKNSFFGREAGGFTGSRNSFFGSQAGTLNEADNNAFFGFQAGFMNTTGTANSFFGFEAGKSNSTKSSNSFFGFQAGLNSTGEDNSFFGKGAGLNNRIGAGNTFLGANAGADNQDGNFNTYVGFKAAENFAGGRFNTCLGAFSCTGQGFPPGSSRNTMIGAIERPITISRLNSPQANGDDNSTYGFDAGKSLTTGSQNSFYGSKAGTANTTGTDNSFFGFEAGKNITGPTGFGSRNSFFGSKAGSVNAGGSDSSFFGFEAGMKNNTAGGNSFFGAQAGKENTIGESNSFFGNLAGTANVSGSHNSIFGTLAGNSNTNGSFNSFYGASSGTLNQSGNENSFYGFNSGRSNVGGGGNTFIGNDSGDNNSSGNNNTFVGYKTGQTNQTGGNNTTLGANANVFGTNLTFATAVGAGAVVQTSNTILLGRGNGSDNVYIPGMLIVENLGFSGTTALCRNNLFEISFCSSSLRYKTNIAPFSSGLNLINRLRPITFDWKQDGAKDLGLVAEDVAAVEPLLVTYNKAGQVEGVKYDRIAVILLNAVKEQQKIIEQQQQEIKQQQLRLESFPNTVNGTIVTDENGEAVITLANDFASTHKDFRYQLTVMGQFAQAIILEEIKENRFKIKTDKPNVKISWQVTGARR